MTHKREPETAPVFFLFARGSLGTKGLATKATVSAALPSNTLIILGPTAVGKSELAVLVAEQLGGEIVGADAYQLYRGLDILSAKPSKEQLARVPHHLIGEIPLSASIDVARYRELAMERIHDIASRGKVPIVCGGAGMYARALTHGLSETPPANAELREELAREPLEKLVERLRTLDPATTVDVKNPRRVIRALEVCILSGRPFSSFRAEWGNVAQIRGVILTRSRESLQARIVARTSAMFAEGVVEEVAATKDVIGSTAGQMLGLREIQEHLAGALNRKQCEEAIMIATRQYAKRQMTWFRKESGYTWADLDVVADAPHAIVALAEPR